MGRERPQERAHLAQRLRAPLGLPGSHLPLARRNSSPVLASAAPLAHPVDFQQDPLAHRLSASRPPLHPPLEQRKRPRSVQRRPRLVLSPDLAPLHSPPSVRLSSPLECLAAELHKAWAPQGTFFLSPHRNGFLKNNRSYFKGLERRVLVKRSSLALAPLCHQLRLVLPHLRPLVGLRKAALVPPPVHSSQPVTDRLFFPLNSERMSFLVLPATTTSPFGASSGFGAQPAPGANMFGTPQGTLGGFGAPQQTQAKPATPSFSLGGASGGGFGTSLGGGFGSFGGPASTGAGLGSFATPSTSTNFGLGSSSFGGSSLFGTPGVRFRSMSERLIFVFLRLR